jgi:dolichol-phosphate mannosyltransferase
MTAPVLAALDGPPLLPDAPHQRRRLAVVVPCYNEAESLANLAAGLARLRAAVAEEYELEMVLVDDGSRDGTWPLLQEQFADEPAIRLLKHETNRGIAAAIGTGIREATAEIVASLDADCTYEPTQLVALLRLLNEGVDVVVASPYHPAGRVVGVPRWRLALSRFASRLYGLVMRNRLHTYTSCVRIYRRSSVVDLALSHGGFVGVVELLWQVDRRGGRIVECPAVLSVRATGQSKMRIARTTLAHLRFLTRCAWQRLTGAAGSRQRPARSAKNDPSRFATRTA